MIIIYDRLTRHLFDRWSDMSPKRRALQQMFDLTDKAAVEALAFNPTWHYAPDIRSESDCHFCRKALRTYRAQVVESGLDKVLSRHLTDKSIVSFYVDTPRQRIDSTALRSAMRNLTLGGCRRHARRFPAQAARDGGHHR